MKKVIQLILVIFFGCIFVFGQQWLLDLFNLNDDRVVEIAIFVLFGLSWLACDKFFKN